MPVWKQCEINIINRFFEGRVGPTTIGDYEALTATLPGRSVAAVKKKALQLRVQQRPLRESSPPPAAQSRRAWPAEEIRRLEMAYTRAEGHSKEQKLQLICPLFPGRTVKGLAAQLRNKSPEVYYGRAAAPASREDRAETSTRAERPVPMRRREAGDDQIPAQVAPQHSATGAERRVRMSRREAGDNQIPAQVAPQHSGPTGSAVTQPRRTTETRETNSGQRIVPRIQIQTIQPRTNIPQDDGLRKKFQSTWSRVADARRKIKMIGHRPDPGVVAKVDALLGVALEQVEASQQTPEAKRERSKRAIYAAGTVLAQELAKKKTGRPKHVAVAQVIRKLKRQIELAEELRSWKGGGATPLRYPLKIKARELRKSKVTPSQYIEITRDRILTLEKSRKHQREAEQAQAIRSEFAQKPSVQTIRERPERGVLDADTVEHFYRRLYSADDGPGRRPTPRFNKWLAELRRHKEETANTGRARQDQQLEARIEAALKATAPWKAPGEDGIPAGIYKLLANAKQYLARYVREVLEGTRVCSEKDVRGRVILIHKSGDKQDPANYRPIALLNSDYKILTSVIAAIIKQKLPTWAIPKEQLARGGVWGTVHGLLQDKAVSTVARRNGMRHYSAWIDFTKAYDSVSHWQLRRLVRALPIEDAVKQVLVGITRKWSVRVRVGKATTKPIYIKRGVYQGDTMSPLLFVLATAFIVEEVNIDRKVTKAAKGRQVIIAYMDDIKLHAPTKASIELAAKCVAECAGEIGLAMNIKKCGIYCRQDDAEEDDGGNGGGDGEEEEGAAFLPRVREGYKYLGITQLELDTEINVRTVRDKSLQGVREILASRITPAQKIKLINTTVVTAATYVLGNIFSGAKRASVLKEGRELDKDVRKLLVEHKVKTYSTSNASVYLDASQGGLGLRSIADEVALQYIKKGAYLEKHPDLEETRSRYAVLERKGWKNPKTDMEALLEDYGIDKTRWNEVTDPGAYARSLASEARKEQQARWLAEWGQHMEYGRVVAREQGHVTFPAYTSLYMDSWRISMLHAAAEDQLQGLGAIPTSRRMCTRGCNRQETAYHVAVACATPEYNTRHDIIVAKVLRVIAECTAPRRVVEGCQFSKATMVEDYEWGGRTVKIRAGVPVKTDRRIVHNKPDVMVILTNPAEVFVLEIAVSHLRNIRVQERIKRTRYEINSMTEVHAENVSTTTRDTNLMTELRQMYRCPVELGVMVIGAFGEALNTTESRKAAAILQKIGVPRRRVQQLIKNACYSAAVSTSTILMNRTRAVPLSTAETA